VRYAIGRDEQDVSFNQGNRVRRRRK